MPLALAAKSIVTLLVRTQMIVGHDAIFRAIHYRRMPPKVFLVRRQSIHHDDVCNLFARNFTELAWAGLRQKPSYRLLALTHLVFFCLLPL